MGARNQKRPKKAGTSGLFRYGAFAAVVLLATAGTGAAQPLLIKVASAQAYDERRTNETVISLKMSEASRKAFAEITRMNVGHKCEIRVDGKRISAPIIREPILEGSATFAVDLTIEQARDLAARLASGAAKLEFEIVN